MDFESFLKILEKSLKNKVLIENWTKDSGCLEK